MVTFYIASSFRNRAQVQYVRDTLIDAGLSCTYDFTKHGRATTMAQLKAIGEEEVKAVHLADMLIILLPAGKGSHVELGLAIAEQKAIYLHAPGGEALAPEVASTFYYLPIIHHCTGTLDEFVQVVVSETFNLTGRF
ncbi:group-specific protein [Shouchella lonarensis]|uniref:Nucleoside 2-deoxyribosyltransferase n=1 Tax=Shouchella lonarensis TaxID=1464122 RepID=A0A1G6HKT7_9BACI|nr:group-specific protein [Shouchella lonarensis]SDB94794.1 Nucleoside 2-deoxyribosyltransferase [Shouchella lonarensis]